jgi:hypothetical protein
MNKKEQNIILNIYKEIYNTHNVLEIDKTDTLREFRFLLKNLNLTKEMYITENQIITEQNNLNLTVKEMFSMIFDTFAKYNIFVNYNIEEINLYYDNLQYEFTEEENKCHNARIKYITDHQ